MDVHPLGLPAALKAWREHGETLVRVRCGAPGCEVEVGAVYRSPDGFVVESHTTLPEHHAPAISNADLAGMAEELGIVGLVDHDITEATGADGATGGETVTVWAQIDLLSSDLYWQDPVPLCPEHGPLRVDRAELSAAVRHHRDVYEAVPTAG